MNKSNRHISFNYFGGGFPHLFLSPLGECKPKYEAPSRLEFNYSWRPEVFPLPIWDKLENQAAKPESRDLI